MQRFSLAARTAMLPLVVVALSSSVAIAAAPGAKGAERARVIVAYKDGQRGNAERALAMAGADVHYEFASRRGFAATMPAAALEGLSRNPAFDYVEEDAKRYPLAQTMPYGIGKVQADLVADTAAGNTTVCIIDSGLDRNHEDLVGNKLGGEYDSGTGNWYTDESSHGTHVAGTIAAVNNGVGVVGVLPGKTVNLWIVKVFGADGWAYSSSLVAALDKCVQKKTAGTNLVINMSLGGSVKSRFEETSFASAYANQNVLSIAAAGNDGTSRNSYPASYSSVISVAAVDSQNVRASFSQYNSQVELAAPGVAVLSSVPTGSMSTASVTAGTLAPAAEPMDGSPRASVSNRGIVNCGIGDRACAGASGKICLIQRGTVSFADKVLNCQNSGGLAAIIYNNEAGALNGTLGGIATTIPSVGISAADGAAILAQLTTATTGSVAVTASAYNYAYFDGTSMASPHVAGVAALVWSQKPTCTNAQIRAALGAYALDIAPAGRDAYTGFGLVQAANTLTKLGTGCGATSGGGGGGTKPGKGK
jgi:serine protease